MSYLLEKVAVCQMPINQKLLLTTKVAANFKRYKAQYMTEMVPE